MEQGISCHAEPSTPIPRHDPATVELIGARLYLHSGRSKERIGQELTRHTSLYLSFLLHPDDHSEEQRINR